MYYFVIIYLNGIVVYPSIKICVVTIATWWTYELQIYIKDNPYNEEILTWHTISEIHKGQYVRNTLFSWGLHASSQVNRAKVAPQSVASDKTMGVWLGTVKNLLAYSLREGVKESILTLY